MIVFTVIDGFSNVILSGQTKTSVYPLLLIQDLVDV